MRTRSKRTLAALLAAAILGAAVFLTAKNCDYWRRLLCTRQGYDGGRCIDQLLYESGAESVEGAACEKIWLEIPEQPNCWGNTTIRQAAYLPGQGVYVAVTTGADNPLTFDVAAGEVESFGMYWMETSGLSRKLLEAFFPIDLGPEPAPFTLRFYASGLDARDQPAAVRIGIAAFQ